MTKQSIKEIYINALLADASYVDYDKEQKESINKDLSIRMTATQAKFIQDNFDILTTHHLDDKQGTANVGWVLAPTPYVVMG